MLRECKQKENAFSDLAEKYLPPICQKKYSRESGEKCIILEAGNWPAGENDRALQTARGNLAQKSHKHFHA